MRLNGHNRSTRGITLLNPKRTAPRWFTRDLHKPTRGEFYAIAAKLMTIGTGGISLILAITVLKPTILGYYYSFLSIAAWRVAMDGGMSYLVVRFMAHEWVHMLRDGEDTDAAARIASLIRFVLPAYALLGLFFGAITLLIGKYWFGGGPLPWAQWFPALAVQAVVVMLNLCALAVRSLVEGINDIVSSNKGTLISTILGAMAGWCVLLFGNPLYAIPIWFGVSALVSMVVWYPALRPVLRFSRYYHASIRLSWRHEFWPLQWRLVLSMVGAMAMFQLFVPITFGALGPVSAGRIGIALQVFQAIDQLGNVWVQARVPSMAMLAAHRHFQELRGLVARTTINGVLTSLMLAAVTLAGYGLVRAYLPQYGARLCNFMTLVLFLLTSVVFQVEHVQAAVVRCQKKEPFVLLSLLGGALMASMSYIFIRLWSEEGVALAFALCICFFLVPGTMLISRRYSNHWDAN